MVFKVLTMTEEWLWIRDLFLNFVLKEALEIRIVWIEVGFKIELVFVHVCFVLQPFLPYNLSNTDFYCVISSRNRFDIPDLLVHLGRSFLKVYN